MDVCHRCICDGLDWIGLVPVFTWCGYRSVPVHLSAYFRSHDGSEHLWSDASVGWPMCVESRETELLGEYDSKHPVVRPMPVHSEILAISEPFSERNELRV